MLIIRSHLSCPEVEKLLFHSISICPSSSGEVAAVRLLLVLQHRENKEAGAEHEAIRCVSHIWIRWKLHHQCTLQGRASADALGGSASAATADLSGKDTVDERQKSIAELVGGLDCGCRIPLEEIILRASCWCSLRSLSPMLTKDRGPARKLVPPHEKLAVVVVGELVLSCSAM